jgi:hypothetical protein
MAGRQFFYSRDLQVNVTFHPLTLQRNASFSFVEQILTSKAFYTPVRNLCRVLIAIGNAVAAIA